MRQLTREHLSAVLQTPEPPCLSLYQPTHRHHPANQQDPILFRNLLRDLETSLRNQYPTREVRTLLEPFQALARDDHFWNHRTDGLAILRSADRFQLFELQRTVRELVVVADTFHTKPLLRIVQSADRFQILCLNRQEIKLYEGNRDALDPVEFHDVPATITAALGDELTEPRQAMRSFREGSGNPVAMHHGSGQKKDEIELDLVRFFRVVDRAILEHHSRPSGLPLLLAALPEYHTPFRELSHNPFLLADGLRINPDSLSLDELRTSAWNILEPLYLARLARLVEDFQTARAQQRGADDLSSVAQATVAGRVGVLLVDADRQVPGRIDPETGQIELGDLGHPRFDDALDDLAEMVLRMKGEVVIVPAARMPTSTGIAATYRY